jgi:hypothetical protein
VQLKGRGQDQDRAIEKMREFLSTHSNVTETQARAILKFLQDEANRK